MTTTFARPHTIPKNALLSRLVGLGTAVPPFSASQSEILKFISAHFEIRDSTKKLYEKTLSNPSIQKRHFALNSLHDVLERDHKKISDRFKNASAQLATTALRNALRHAGLQADAIDFLATSTCTGYLCPGISSYVMEQAGLRSNIQTLDVTGMGCGAAIPTLHQAHNFVQTHPNAIAAVVCTEICSAAMFSNNDPDIVISNTIFADGSACAILQSQPTVQTNGYGSAHPAIRNFSSLLLPEWRDTLRFQNEDGYLKNVLGKDVPDQSATAASRVVADLLKTSELDGSDISHWILHAGGEKIIDALQSELRLPDSAVASGRTVLKNFGNMSSPTVLFVLSEEMKTRPMKPGERAVISSFGAGFSAYAALLEA